MTTTQANQLTAIYNSTVLHSGDKVLLWTNSNPNTTFAPQTITISGGFSSYRYIMAEFIPTIALAYNDTDYNVVHMYRSIESQSFGSYTTSDNQNVYRRVVTINKTNGTIQISEAYHINYGNTDNTYNIPKYIYGI